MVQIQLVSDLHIEYKNDSVPDPLDFITPSAEILVLAGDIGSLYKYNQLKLFLEKLCTHYTYVLFVPGNHEFYKINDTSLPLFVLMNKLFQLSKEIPNLIVLNKSSVQIDDVCIIGCTLWSEPMVNIPPFIVRINGFNNHVYKNKHIADLKYIENMISYCNENKLKLVVVTHYLPTYDVIPEYKKEKKYISLYASHLDHLLTKDKVHIWMAGHIHHNFDYITENGTRLVGNQLGKPRDNISDYKKNLVIDV